MSPKLDDYIKKGLEAQAKQVHLDEMHQGEIGHAAGEADLWTNGGGNNNGGNEPCMLPPGGKGRAGRQDQGVHRNFGGNFGA